MPYSVKACEAGAPCIVTQIEHFTAKLKDKKLDTRKRAIALMFLVHLVGDVHQPLHVVARNNDRGGNEVFVRVARRTGRLHHLWDSSFVDALKEGDIERVAAAGGGDAKAWAWESYDAVQKIVYKGIPIQPSTAENPIVLPHAYRTLLCRSWRHGFEPLPFG